MRRSGGAANRSGVRNRTAGSDDATVLSSLIRGFRDHLQASVPSDLEFERHLPRALADPAIEFHCAWLDEAPVGYTQTRLFTSVWASGLEAQLDDLFVVPSARGRSVGRSLLRYALARAEARGARRFALNTNEENEAAQSLYRSEGLSPQSHALYPGGREILWVKSIGAAQVVHPREGDVTLVVLISVHPHRRAEFERFEARAAQIMSRHGGRVERRISLSCHGDPSGPDEVHIVAFPDQESFERYRGDPELLALADLREEAIRQTLVWPGRDAPAFGAAGRQPARLVPDER